MMIRQLFRTFILPSAVVWLSIFSATASADDAQVFAVSSNTLLNLNLTQGTSATVESLPLTTSVIAVSPNTGLVYAYGGASTRYFYTWDPVSDSINQISSYTGNQRLDPARMGFASDGTLYISDAQERLHTIDTGTGAVTLLGTMTGLATGPYDATGDLAFSPDGTLYMANYQSLYTVDLTTFAATELFGSMISSPTPADVAVWSGLAFCDGQLYASSAEVRSGQAGNLSGIYSIDLQTGIDTHLYDAPSQLSDLASCASVTGGGSNSAPVAENQFLSTDIDASLSISLQGQDADNDPLTYTVLSQPANGLLAGSGNQYTYTPDSGYSGSDSFTFTVDDGLLTSNTATVNIQIGGPSASDLIIYGANAYGRDQMIELNITQQIPQEVAILPFGTQAMARDPESGFVYFYEWEVSASRFAYWNPANGEINVVRTYSPINGFYMKRMDFAPDGTLYISDDQEGLYTIDKVNGDLTFLGAVTGLESGIWEATGDMTFTPDGTMWVSNYRTVSSIDMQTLVATPVFTNLIGTAPLMPYEDAVLTGIAYCDGDFYTTSAEQLTGQSAVFRVDATTGAETFLFYAQAILNDITSCSTAVFPSNIAPVASDLSATTLEEQTVPLILLASDADGDPLVYSIYNSPANGTLSGNGSNYTYTPFIGYSGEDSFQYIASDGTSTSNVATVSITVEPSAPANSAPVAQSQNLSALFDTPLAVTLSGIDPDGDTLSYAVVSQPLNGSLAGAADSYTYTPDIGYTGPDTFEFRVNDGQLNSENATVSIQVQPPSFNNLPPEAISQEVSTLQEQSVAILLGAIDPDGDPLTYELISQPLNGSLTGSGASLTYIPSPGFVGTDSFDFVANDGEFDSDIANVIVNVDSLVIQNQGIFGTNGSGTILGVDVAQLTAGSVGSLPFGTSAIALDPLSSRLYFYGGDALRYLAYWDPASATVTQVQSYSGAARLEGVRMDFSPDGTLYMSDSLERLYTIDKDTGVVTLLGTVSGLGTGPYDATGDMLFASDGTLWMANYRSLYNVDLTTLAATEQYSGMISTAATSDIALWSGLATCNGTVYASSVELRAGQAAPVSGLFTIDLQSGTETYLFDAPAQINDLSSCN